MELKRKIAVAITSSALIFNAFAQTALAGTTLEISGNGSNSDNTVDIKTTVNTTVVQDNNAKVENNISASSNTGNNDANDNTGGNVDIDTGKATTDVDVENTLNKNVANVDCCPGGDTDVLISGNGTHSDNDVNLDQNNSTEVFQSNNANVENNVDADSTTGNNDANDNTGGNVGIDTGEAETSVEISTAANVNMAMVGGDGKGGGSVSAKILGNGSNSDNTIDLELVSLALISQDNRANVENNVDADSNTGNNDANDNTGGNVDIDTGKATTDVDIDNMVNFNWADTDCGCLLDKLVAKISGNATDSDNDIKAKLDQKLEVFQENCGKGQEHGWWWRHGKCEVANNVDADSDSGKNDTNDNTGDPEGDPSVDTGDAETEVDVTNSGYLNVYGADSEMDFPDFDFDFSLVLNLGDLLDWLMSHS